MFVRTPALLLLGCVAAVAFAATLLVRPAKGPRVVRWYFERAGGGVVKAGQLLATRYDLLPAAYCEELGTLLDSLRPVPVARIRATVQRCLGRPVDELFAGFDDEPIGTASLAQVHGAVLHSGTPVVVKVLKPGVRRLVAVDMSFLLVVAGVLEWFPRFAELQLKAVARQLRRVAIAELDMQREATNLAFFNAAMTKDELPHSAPAPHRHLCGPDVLTMDRVTGVSVRNLLSALHSGDHDLLAGWAQRGITAPAVARLVFRSVIEQSMRHRTFHGDPHPSNLIVSDGGGLNWIDFGLVGWIDEKQWALELRLRQAFLRGEVHGAYLLFLESVGPLPARDLRGFEAEMKQAIHDYIVAARDPDAPISKRSTGAFLISTLSALRRYRLPVSTEVMQLYRAILIADMVMLRLDPGVDWLGVMDDFLVDFVAERTEQAVRSTAEDPSAFTALAGSPATLLAGLDWLDRRLLLGPARPTPVGTAADELVLSFVRLVRFGAFVGGVGTILFAARLVPPPASGPLAGPAAWTVANPGWAVLLAVFANLVLRHWSRRFRR
ncbi:MAG TPA: AarF/ABC1/UbiB kinase family protein [Amycolatopsis sp.]|uniref:ABC1 kinase family protein n=1 Tax=Amycolatopsis sp. TaxID=37632 RepID=UPI002B45BBB1|nr:AarF/ABC1/UbiB kinase family protein [Amycolatopsis sp.]HKS46183.1 AarF/ABC1/UbiB kinase family protein [Amycolatopsis sp.]